MTDDIPQWAVDRVQSILRAEWGLGYDATSIVVQSFARYIASKEEPPVDLLLIEAREAVATWAESVEGFGPYADDYRSGKRDGDSEVGVALAALKRGMELASNA